MKFAILGGGITGLTLAKLLHDEGLDFTVYEMENTVGGLCRSEMVGDFVFDIAGGHILYSSDDEIMRLIRRNLGEENLVQTVRNTKIFFKGNFVKYPFENGLSDLSKEDNYECVRGYIESYFNRQLGQSRKPDNFKDWLVYKFGTGISEKFMFPYNEKLWKTDLSRLGIEWVDGRVPNAPIDDILKASIGIETKGYVHQSIFYYPHHGGMQALPDRIAGNFENRIRLSCPVTEVAQTGKGWIVNGEEYDTVFSSIPIPELVKVMPDVPERIQAATSKLDYLSIACFLIALDMEVPFPYSWIYLPHPENGPCNRITYLSNYSPGNAPRGKSSILAEVTYRDEMKTDDAFVGNLIERLHVNGLLDKRKVVGVGQKKSKYAYISFLRDFPQNREKVIGYLEGRGLHLLGRFGRFEYFNVDHCIRSVLDFFKEFRKEAGF